MVMVAKVIDYQTVCRSSSMGKLYTPEDQKTQSLEGCVMLQSAVFVCTSHVICIL